MKQKNKPKILESRKVYKNKWIEVEERKIDDGNSTDDYYVVTNIPKTASILLVDDQNRILTVRQYRFAVDTYTVDIPGGLVDADESPKKAAVRELYEETGYKVLETTLLFKYFLDSGQKNSVKYVYFARCSSTTQVDSKMEKDINTKWMLLSEFNELLNSNQILEPTLICAVLFYMKSIK